MSTIRASTLSNLSGTSTSMDNAINGSAKAWVNFNGTGTVAIRRSYNVSSITDNGTGDYTLNFTNAMPDADYSLAGSGSDTGTYVGQRLFMGGINNAGSARIGFCHTPYNFSDPGVAMVIVFR